MKTRNCVSALWTPGMHMIVYGVKTLFKKLLGYGVCTNFVSLLRNMYEKTKLRVRLPRGITKFFSLKYCLDDL